MNHTDVLGEAIRILKERGEKYGDVQIMFERAAKLASILLDREVKTYEVVTIVKCLKDIRKITDRFNIEHYVDNINYEAFSYQLVTADYDKSIEDDMTAAIAKKFAPVTQTTDGENV